MSLPHFIPGSRPTVTEHYLLCGEIVLWWPRSARRVCSGTAHVPHCVALCPHYSRSLSAPFPQHLHSLSALFPRYLRTVAAVLLLVGNYTAECILCQFRQVHLIEKTVAKTPSDQSDVFSYGVVSYG